MKRNKLFIGSRASKLALIYANKVKNEISKYYYKEIIIKEIKFLLDLGLVNWH